MADEDPAKFDDIATAAAVPPPYGTSGGDDFAATVGNPVVGENGKNLSIVFAGSTLLTLYSINRLRVGPLITNYDSYGLAVGIVGMLVTIFGLLSEKKGGLSPQMSKMVSGFLLAWYIAAIAVLTFFSGAIAWTGTTTGYFSILGGFAGSGMMFNDSASGFRDRVARARASFSGSADGGADKARRMYCLVGSIVCLVASSVEMDKCLPKGVEQCQETAWAVSCATISTVICICWQVPALNEKLEPHSKHIAMFMGLLWLAGLAVITIINPFNTTLNANGFVGTWIAGVSAFAICYEEGFNGSGM